MQRVLSRKPGKRFLGKNSLVFSQRFASHTGKQVHRPHSAGKNAASFFPANRFCPHRPSTFFPPCALRHSMNTGKTAVRCGQNSREFFPTPNRWNWTKLGARAIIKFSKIWFTSCMYDYRKRRQESEQDFWPLTNYSDRSGNTNLR